MERGKEEKMKSWKHRNMMHGRKRKEKKRKEKKRKEKNRKEKKNETPFHLLGIEPASPATPAIPPYSLPPTATPPISNIKYQTSNIPTHAHLQAYAQSSHSINTSLTLYILLFYETSS
jgi:hypothetical protein